MIGGTVRSEPHLTVSWLIASQSRAGDTTRGGANSTDQLRYGAINGCLNILVEIALTVEAKFSLDNGRYVFRSMLIRFESRFRNEDQSVS